MKPYVNHIKNKNGARQGIKSQSAMEYLMTYGWAILVIVVVIISLFKFGIFSNNLAPKAQPGSCYVSKTITGGTLAGSCNGELPEFVAQFNGQSSYIFAPSQTVPSIGTINVWIFNRLSSSGSGVPMIVLGTDSSNNYGIGWGFVGGAQNLEFLYGGIAWEAPTTAITISSNTWTNIIVTYTIGGSSTTFNAYVNGVYAGNTVATGLPSLPNAYTSMGWGHAGSYFQGYIADVQIYNASLPTTDIQALYQEGIGGAPIDTNYLAGWWPLNGNANDYSGNNNNGTPVNVIYNSTWSS